MGMMGISFVPGTEPLKKLNTTFYCLIEEMYLN